MAKTNSNDVIEVQKVMSALHRDIANIQGFITQELIKNIQANGGKIFAVDDPKFQQQVHSLLNADPRSEENKGRPVLSFKATEVGIEEKLQALEKKGVPVKETNKIREALNNTREDFANKLNSQEGLENLISQRVAQQLLLNKSDFMVTEKYKRGQRFMTMEEKQNYVNVLQPVIEFSPKVLETLLDPKKDDQYKLIQDKVYKMAIESFGSDKESAVEGVPLLDQKKLKKLANINKFKEAVGKDINPEVTQKKSDPGQNLANEIVNAPDKKDKKIESFESNKKPVIESVPLLDQKKLKKLANINKFKEAVGKDINPEVTQKKADPGQNLANEIVSVFEKKGNKLSLETQTKFKELATKITNKLGAGFVEENMDKIVGAAAKEINKNKTFLSGLRKDLRISSADIQKITDNASKPFEKGAEVKRQKDAEQARIELLSDPDFYKKRDELVDKAKKSGDVRLRETQGNKNLMIEKAKDIGIHIKSQKMLPPPSLKTPAIIPGVTAPKQITKNSSKHGMGL